MNERTAFLKEQTTSAKNKIMRSPMPPELSTKDEPYGIPIRRAMALARVLTQMPLYIGEGELIVGTRTFLRPHSDNTNGSDKFKFRPDSFPEYINDEDIKLFGKDLSSVNKRHYTPDFTLLLDGGIDGVITKATERKSDPTLAPHNIEFLDSVVISYRGLSSLIERYSSYARELAQKAETASERERLSEIAEVTGWVSHNAPRSFREAIQLLWFGHLGTMIESFFFICYGRLDVILDKYLGDTPHDEALELIECLLLKMYDQADLYDHSSIVRHEGQLVVTLGGLLANGESAVSRTTMLFLEAIESVMLPDPEFNLRVSSKNPKEFLDRAAALTVKGANFISYYNDDLFVDSLTRVGLSPEDARSYAFDLCQDVNIPGKNDSWCAYGISLARFLLAMLSERTDFDSFEELTRELKSRIVKDIDTDVQAFHRSYETMMLYRDGRYDEYFERIKAGESAVWFSRSPMCPLPFLSALYHGSIDEAVDMIYDPYPIKSKGAMIGTATEAVNSLAAIKRVVYDEGTFTLSEVMSACKENFEGEKNRVIRAHLKKAPKWGNDDPYVDLLAKEVLEFILAEFMKKELPGGGRLLAGIHQPHPVTTGRLIGATPDGRGAGEPVSVTMTPASGTMKNGATAALKSASVFDHTLINWNYCVMINYYASVFESEGGDAIFKKLLTSYFNRGGMQHQPNVMDAAKLRKAQREPEKYRDLIVRLWGVSAHFVDLPTEMQDEIIARLS